VTRRALVGAGQLEAFTVPPVERRGRPEARRPRPVPARAGARSRRLVLEVERVQSPQRGQGYRLTSPRRLPGWAAVAYRPDELARAVALAEREQDVAAYARWRGSSYDTPEAMERGQRPVPPRAPVSAEQRRRDGERPVSQLPAGAPWGAHRRLLRPDTADPADWTILPNGRWQAPARGDGRPPLTYGPDTLMARRIVERRREAGLPVAA
jgi:hypothetical protein